MCIVPRPARKFHCCLVQRRGCVQEGAKLARENHVDLILAVGGGSVSDCCKVVSAQAKADEDLWELENVKHTRPSEFIPLGTIVTVFGTGSEMNNGAVIHPVLYRHLLPANTARFARFAQNVWGIDPAGKSELKLAQAGVEALASFIKEIGLPTTFAELGIPADTDLKAVADSTVLTGGCCKKLSREELLDILNECR